MRGFSCRPNSFIKNLKYLVSVEKQVCGNVASKAFRPPIVVHTRGFYNIGSAGKHGDYTNMRILTLKRYIHATGIYNSSAGDHYQVLGVPQNASKEEIKKAFYVVSSTNFV
uniref:Chaperone protein DnaJ n=1 Tax=Tanacetum cinerariifolium TaxID=118510 RepID=A0A699IVN2_TANCI|nr:chaperone protein DnaJ [Tanacetum cinerariifolium]